MTSKFYITAILVVVAVILLVERERSPYSPAHVPQPAPNVDIANSSHQQNPEACQSEVSGSQPEVPEIERNFSDLIKNYRWMTENSLERTNKDFLDATILRAVGIDTEFKDRINEELQQFLDLIDQKAGDSTVYLGLLPDGSHKFAISNYYDESWTNDFKLKLQTIIGDSKPVEELFRETVVYNRIIRYPQGGILVLDSSLVKGHYVINLKGERGAASAASIGSRFPVGGRNFHRKICDLLEPN